ncbi:MAG: hypothetical protein Q4C98_00765 [Capnocytophaga sp.]|nr:hypothetical protein [Capnocytophaga sp.]
MKKTIFYLALSFVAVSCYIDSNDNNSNDDSNEETAVIPKKVVRINEDYYITETDYEAVNGKVQTITQTKSYKNGEVYEKKQTTITYENNLPISEKTINLLNNKTVQEISYEYVAGKLVKSVSKIEEADKPAEVETKTYKYEGNNLKESISIKQSSNSTIKEDKNFNYISDTEIEVLKTTSYNMPPSVHRDTTTYTLDSNKRIIKSLSRLEGGRWTKLYQYDNKNNYKKIPLFITTNPEYFINRELTQNNLFHYKLNVQQYDVPDRQFHEEQYNEYQYNDKDYPIIVNGVDKDDSGTEYHYKIEVTY